MLILTTNAGCLFGFFISSFFDYFGQIKMNLMVPILFLLTIHFFPESPEFLLKQNQRNVCSFSVVSRGDRFSCEEYFKKTPSTFFSQKQIHFVSDFQGLFFSGGAASHGERSDIKKFKISIHEGTN